MMPEERDRLISQLEAFEESKEAEAEIHIRKLLSLAGGSLPRALRWVKLAYDRICGDLGL